MNLQAYKGYFENGQFYTSGKAIHIPERRQVVLTILEEQPKQDDIIDEQLAAMDEFIAAIKTSDEEVPKFERLKLREVGCRGGHRPPAMNRNNHVIHGRPMSATTRKMI